MTNRLIFIAWLFLFQAQTYSQELTNNGTPKTNKFGFSAGYFGYWFSNPGFQIGMEHYLSTTKNFQVIGSINTSFYNQPNVQSAFSVGVRIGQRYTTNFGLFLESHLGLGVQQTFFTTKIFEYNAGISTITDKKESKTGLAPNISFGIGYDFAKKIKIPLKFYLRPSFHWLYPDRNLVFQSSYTIETGLIYAPTFKKKQKKGSS